MNKIHLSLVTSEGSALDKAVSYVNIPTAAGSIGVLSGHASMLCAVKKGPVSYRCEGGPVETVIVGDGIANVNHNEVTLLVSAVQTGENID